MADIFLGQCPTVPTIGSSEVRFSVNTHNIRRLGRWPLQSHLLSCSEIAPSQPRLQWGNQIYGPRLDSFHGLRFGSAENNLTLGFRSTNVGSQSTIGPVENQRVGVATLTVAGRYRFKYWNDHGFWWWPIGDGGDQGDTAGLQFSYNLGSHGFKAGHDWQFSDLNLTMRLASGIPVRGSEVPMGDGEVYTDVKFNAVDRGDLALSTGLSNHRGQRLEIGVTVNSGWLRHEAQSDIVHRNLDIPEFPVTRHFSTMVWIKLSEI